MMRRLTFTLATVNAVLNLMVIGIFMPYEVITLYGMTGAAALHGSRWFYAIYAAIPLLVAGAFLIADSAAGKKSGGDEEDSSAIDDFLSGKSRKSDNVDMVATWFFAVISWVMTGLALNEIENIGVIMPSIIVVMLSAFVIFTAALYSGGEKLQICGIDIKWLKSGSDEWKRSQRLSMLLGVMSGMVGVCLAAWSLVVQNNIPNCIAVAELFAAGFTVPLLYTRSQIKKQDSNKQ